MLSKLAISLVFSLLTANAYADYGRTNCRPDTSNPIKNQCLCDIYDKTGNSTLTGFSVVSCDQLACEEFDSSSAPAECAEQLRGVTCFLARFPINSCALNMPRVSAKLDAAEVCNEAVADLDKNGYASSYYRSLDLASCVEAGASYPLPTGWTFTGSFVDGWN